MENYYQIPMNAEYFRSEQVYISKELYKELGKLSSKTRDWTVYDLFGNVLFYAVDNNIPIIRQNNITIVPFKFGIDENGNGGFERILFCCYSDEHKVYQVHTYEEYKEFLINFNPDVKTEKDLYAFCNFLYSKEKELKKWAPNKKGFVHISNPYPFVKVINH